MKEKALFVRQPWAWLIVNGHKPVENRTRRFHYRGALLIGASQGMTRDDYFACSLFVLGFAPLTARTIPDPEELQRGGIIGRVNVVDCVEDSVSNWFCGPFGIVMKDPEVLPFYGCKGQLNIFDVEYPS